MDPYDSDSSGLEDEDFTDTGVLLGYASEEVIDDTISHLGGWPVCPQKSPRSIRTDHNQTWLDESTPPPGDFANCKVCNRPMHLLLELHGDLPDHFPDDERRLYIFGCCRKTCNRKQGSIRALRATRKIKVEQAAKPKTEETEKKEEEKKPEAPKQDLGANLFGAGSLTGSVSGNANPFSASSGSSSAQANPFATPATPAASSSQEKATKQPESQTVTTLTESFADKVRISSTPKIPPPEAAGPPTPWPPQSAFPKPYPHLYLDAEYETLSRPSTPTIPENVTFEPADDTAAGSSAAAQADLKDAFESELDKTFQRFSSRLSQNPEQVLRYEFRGSPLLYTHTDEVGKKLHDPKNPDAKVNILPSGGSRMPSCEYCGCERLFELQLVPHAISVLEDGREGVGLGPKDDPGMEWGTIILGVCGRDCAPAQTGVVGWREEWVGVQWEEIK